MYTVCNTVYTVCIQFIQSVYTVYSVYTVCTVYPVRVPPGIAYIKDHVFRIGFVLADLVCCYEIEILAALVSQKALFGSIRCTSCVAVG